MTNINLWVWKTIIKMWSNTFRVTMFWGTKTWSSVVIDNSKYQWLWIPDTNTGTDKDWNAVPNPAIVSATWASWDYRLCNEDASSDPSIDNISSDVKKWDTVFFDGALWYSETNSTPPHIHDANEIQYDNTASTLTATEVQAAIDELKVITDNIESSDVDSFNWRTWTVVSVSWDYTADQVTETATRVFVTPAEKTQITTNAAKVDSVVAWANITVDNSDPQNPVISASAWVDEWFVIWAANTF